MLTHLTTCSLCEAMCGLEVETDATRTRVTGIRGDENDPLSRGYICPKAAALGDLHDDPDRLRMPMRNDGQGHFTPIDWDNAFAEIGERINDIRERFGRHAVGVYVGNPAVHSYATSMVVPTLFSALQTKNKFTPTSMDQLPHMLVAQLLFGHSYVLPVPDIDRTALMVVLGGNPVVSGGSMMSAPGFARRARALQARGGRLVVVDPRKTRTAALADQHVAIRPGTDAHLLAALVHVIVNDDAVNLSAAAAYVDGAERLPQLFAPFTPERAARSTGLEANVIVELARALVTAPSAAVYGRVGLCTQRFGALNLWLTTVLAAITGNLDAPGGLMFPRPAADLVTFGRGASAGTFGRYGSLRGLPEFNGELPVSALRDEMARPDERKLRALITLAGNPALSVPGGDKLARALGDLDLFVAIDPWKNATTRHADFILPPTSALQRDNYDLVFRSLAVRDTAKYSPAVLPRRPDEKDDWEIVAGLLGPIKGIPWAHRAQLAALRAATPRRLLDLMLRRGPHHTSLRVLGETPHGLDLGPLIPQLPERLQTPNKRIDLIPEVYRTDLVRAAATLDDEPPQTMLIGRRLLQTNNSWMANVPRLAKGKNRCTLLLHPDDAARWGIITGATVSVQSAAGRLEVPAEVSDEMRPGVVSLPHGFGHDDASLSVARQRPGHNVNVLTDAEVVDELSGNAVLNGVPVDIQLVPAREPAA